MYIPPNPVPTITASNCSTPAECPSIRFPPQSFAGRVARRRKNYKTLSRLGGEPGQPDGSSAIGDHRPGRAVGRELESGGDTLAEQGDRRFQRSVRQGQRALGAGRILYEGQPFVAAELVSGKAQYVPGAKAGNR